jgi:hypothetical protein
MRLNQVTSHNESPQIYAGVVHKAVRLIQSSSHDGSPQIYAGVYCVFKEWSQDGAVTWDKPHLTTEAAQRKVR